MMPVLFDGAAWAWRRMLRVPPGLRRLGFWLLILFLVHEAIVW